MTYDPLKHHRRSTRLPDHDYSAPGAYFVTLCLKHRACLLGGPKNGVMWMNEAGRLVESVWLSLPDRYDRIALDDYVVMPDHFHGILWILSEPEWEASAGPGPVGPDSVGPIHESALLLMGAGSIEKAVSGECSTGSDSVGSDSVGPIHESALLLMGAGSIEKAVSGECSTGSDSVGSDSVGPIHESALLPASGPDEGEVSGVFSDGSSLDGSSPLGPSPGGPSLVGPIHESALPGGESCRKVGSGDSSAGKGEGEGLSGGGKSERDWKKRRRRMLLPMAIGYFKMNSARKVNTLLNRRGALWQEDYYERIIRSERELRNVRRYISKNFEQWRRRK